MPSERTTKAPPAKKPASRPSRITKDRAAATIKVLTATSRGGSGRRRQATPASQPAQSRSPSPMYLDGNELETLRSLAPRIAEYDERLQQLDGAIQSVHHDVQESLDTAIAQIMARFDSLPAAGVRSSDPLVSGMLPPLLTSRRVGRGSRLLHFIRLRTESLTFTRFRNSSVRISLAGGTSMTTSTRSYCLSMAALCDQH